MKILYGVPGEGMGHATRSKVIIEHLLKEHDVQVVSSNRAYTFLRQAFPGRVHEIRGFHLAYNNAVVSKLKTTLTTLRNGPENLRTNFLQYRQLHDQFRPNLVISDFESFSFFYARYHRLPIISIDNMQVLSRCRIEIELPDTEKANCSIARSIVKAKVPGCDHYLITSFFDAPIIKENTTLVPPIMREQIIAAKPTTGKHVLVYQSSTSQKNLVQILQQIPEITFHVYGFNRDEVAGNVRLMPFSEQGFLDDLASCLAVISNGGFSLLSEAVYLHKPVCSIPIQGQFEQYLNAAYIEKEGYGRNFSTITPDAIKAFLYDVHRFSDELKKYKQNGNKQLFNNLEALIYKATEHKL